MTMNEVGEMRHKKPQDLNSLHKPKGRSIINGKKV